MQSIYLLRVQYLGERDIYLQEICVRVCEETDFQNKNIYTYIFTSKYNNKSPTELKTGPDDLNRYFSKEGTQRTKKHMKKTFNIPGH